MPIALRLAIALFAIALPLGAQDAPDTTRGRIVFSVGESYADRAGRTRIQLEASMTTTDRCAPRAKGFGTSHLTLGGRERTFLEAGSARARPQARAFTLQWPPEGMFATGRTRDDSCDATKAGPNGASR